MDDNDLILYQPCQDQILVYESATSLALQTFLKMIDLTFSIEYRKNAEHMSPTGEIPFITYKGYIVSGFNSIISFLTKKDLYVDKFNGQEKSDEKAYTSLIDSALLLAEMYFCWIDSETYSHYTYPRYSMPYNWPLSSILCCRKKRWAAKKLMAFTENFKDKNEVIDSVMKAFTSFSDLLKSRPYLLGPRASIIDALFFGHVSSIFDDGHFSNILSPIPNEHASIYEYYKRILEQYYTGSWEPNSYFECFAETALP